MITRRHSDARSRSEAHYSPCEAYRYGLRRDWDTDGGSDRGAVMFIMLNPSTATERANDPTIERCERRARMMGYSGLRIVNLFAYRATRPADLRAAADPVGPDNDAFLLRWMEEAALTLAAWGVHGTFKDRDRAVLDRVHGPLFHLGLTKEGHPRHPLYVPYATGPTLWER